MFDGKVTDELSTEKKEPTQVTDISIGMIETGEWSDPKGRLEKLGYDVTLIPPTSGIDTFRDYDVIYLPLQWASAVIGDYATIEAHASDYQQFVQEGGGLFVDQPNPYKQPGDQVTPTLLPYPITFYNWYEEADWPPIIVNPDHYITEGLSPDEMPFPADQMISVDPTYEILAEGAYTHSPSLVVTEFGKGRILVQTAHPGYTAIHPFSDEVYTRMVDWVSGVGVEPSVSISTDKFKYSPGDTMTITISIANPTEDSVMFQWYWGVPRYRIWIRVMSSSIPAGYDDTLDYSFTIPKWGPTPFGNVFYTELTDAGGEVLDADVTWWAYSPGGKAMPAVDVDIAKEIKETIKRVELPS